MTTISERSMRRQTPLESALKETTASFLFVFVYSCGYNLLLLTPSIYLLQIYDRVLSSHSVDTLVMLSLIVCVAVVVGALLDAVRRAALARIGSWLERRLRPEVLSGTLDCAARVSSVGAGDAFRHLSTMRQFLDSPASALLFDIPWAPVFLALLFLVHPLLGAIGMGAAVLLLAFALASDWLTRRFAAEAGWAAMRSQSFLASVLKHVELVRAMGMREGALRLIEAEAEKASRAQDGFSHRQLCMQAFSRSTRALTQIVMMGSACWLVLRNDTSPGIIFVASLLIGRGLAPVEGAIGAWKGFGIAHAAYRDLNRMFSAVAPDAEVAQDLAFHPAGRIVLDNASYAFPGARTYAVAGVSLTLERGDCLAILGPSGSGKSTLGRLIAGVCRPLEGRALLDGCAIADLRDDSGCCRVGYLPQDIELFGGAIRDVIGRFAGGEVRDVVTAARMVGLHETILRLPKGYDTDVGDGGRILLRAQRQQLGLARAVYGNPNIVVLDDPNSSLDYRGECLLFELMRAMRARGVTVVVITHRMGILSATNKIAILQNGRLSAFGDSEAIYENHLRPRQIRAQPA